MYKWKFILSALELYLFYIKYNNNILKEKFFYNKDLFCISIDLYFNYPENNLYQNIFVEIIKLITDEKCVDYLNETFLVINEKEGQNDFISKLINDL